MPPWTGTALNGSFWRNRLSTWQAGLELVSFRSRMIGSSLIEDWTACIPIPSIDHLYIYIF